jgi:alpha-beta hydrolase superfamily lysophospholipase
MAIGGGGLWESRARQTRSDRTLAVLWPYNNRTAWPVSKGLIMFARIAHIVFGVLLGCLWLSAPAWAFGSGPANLTLKAADGGKVYARLYKADKARAVILAFHQAGSNKAEYATIAPQLQKDGYTVLAIDQRSGGKLFGKDNETVKKRGKSGQYLEAMPDLEAALEWGGKQGLPVIVWGSSYSSAMVFLLCAKHPNSIAAALAFSPGEYLGTETMVQQAAAKVTQPLFVTSGKQENEVAAAKLIFDASPAKNKIHFVPKAGVHGSSTLILEKNPAGQQENWQAVRGFLKGLGF